MDAAAQLVEVEAIKQLKARYCRLLDTKQWIPWRELLSDDFISDTSQSGGRVVFGADAFGGFVRRIFDGPTRHTVHHLHAPEIEITSPTTASGVWALNDVVALMPMFTLIGYGHCHDTYVKADDHWRIASSTLTRLRQDLSTGLFSIYLTPRWRDAVARLALGSH